jgi:hypothetical protein
LFFNERWVYEVSLVMNVTIAICITLFDNSGTGSPSSCALMHPWRLDPSPQKQRNARIKSENPILKKAGLLINRMFLRTDIAVFEYSVKISENYADTAVL